MKKFYALLVILVALTLAVSAQTINIHLYGTVLRDSTLLPVPNHEVDIQADSNSGNFTFYAVRNTNQSGSYDCLISNVPTSGTPIVFTVKTKNCDSSWMVQTFIGNVEHDTINFFLCNGDCHASYTHYTDSSNVLNIHFTDTSTPHNLITSRLWNFGDPQSGAGNISTNFDPWHTYSSPGVYTVCLTIATSTGCSSQFCDSIVVGSNNGNCENWFTYTSTGLTYTFEGHTHSAYPTTYTWNMGDGTTGLTGHVVTHTYAISGSYTVTLTSVDSIGCAWTRTQVVNVQVQTYDLYGYAILNDNLYVDHGLAELMRSDSGSIVTVASVEFGDSLGMYHFGGVSSGHYYIRISLTESSSYYGLYVPTYYHDAINWANATVIELGQPANPYNVHLHHVGTFEHGTDSIKGAITQNGKYNSKGSPAANVEVLLEDATGVVLEYAMTNPNGEFGFTTLSAGTYKVYPEMIEKATTPSTVVLDATHTGANIGFAIQGSNISGIKDIAAQSDFAVSDVYPNPVTDNANLTIHTLHSTGVSIGLYSITGEFVTELNVELRSGANKITLPVSDLRKGLYYIKVEKQDGGVVVKKFITGR
jgi:PKD repeat protein